MIHHELVRRIQPRQVTLRRDWGQAGVLYQHHHHLTEEPVCLKSVIAYIKDIPVLVVTKHIIFKQNGRDSREKNQVIIFLLPEYLDTLMPPPNERCYLGLTLLTKFVDIYKMSFLGNCSFCRFSQSVPKDYLVLRILFI